jgi:hypothetical protein
MTNYPAGRYSEGTIQIVHEKKENLMKSTASLHGAALKKGTEYREQFMAQFNQYLATQHPIIRGLHLVLKVLAVICFALPFIFGAIALYNTYLWATTGSFSSLGQATNLPIAWVNFGLSCSLMVFPWGLDSMLLRAFHTDAFLPYAYGNARKPIKFMTGWSIFFAGLGIMCAGAPGAATIPGVIWQFIQNLF